MDGKKQYYYRESKKTGEIPIIDAMKRNLVLIIIMSIFFSSSGCISDQTHNAGTKNAVQQTAVVVNPPPSPVRNTITIDPIQDFPTDSSFSINGSSLLNVTGTTDFPAGTELLLKISNKDGVQTVCQTSVKVIKNVSGPNTFSYTCDMKGNSPGQYQAYVRDYFWLSKALVEFKIASDLPYPSGISIDSVGTIVIGKDLSISGTTEMPPGSDIKINTGIFKHPCPMQPVPDKDGKRSLCGGSCLDTGFSEQTVRVSAGTGKVNIWNASIRTNDWCPTEAYSIYAKAVNYTNVAPAWELINLA